MTSLQTAMDGRKEEHPENAAVVMELLYEHAVRFRESRESDFRDLDTKAASQLSAIATVLALAIPAFALILGKDSAILPSGWVFWFCFAAYLSALLLLLGAGWLSMRAYKAAKVEDVVHPKVTLESLAKGYGKTDPIIVKGHLLNEYAKASESYLRINEQKSDDILKAQKHFRWSLVLLVLFVCVMAVGAGIKGGVPPKQWGGGVTVGDDKPSGGGSSETGVQQFQNPDWKPTSIQKGYTQGGPLSESRGTAHGEQGPRVPSGGQRSKNK